MSNDGQGVPPSPDWHGMFAIAFYIGLITVTGVFTACLLQEKRDKEQAEEKMTPEYIRTLRSHAKLVQDRLEMAQRLDYSAHSKEQFEWAEKQFKERYPHYEWREWVEKEQGLMK